MLTIRSSSLPPGVKKPFQFWWWVRNSSSVSGLWCSCFGARVGFVALPPHCRVCVHVHKLLTTECSFKSMFTFKDCVLVGTWKYHQESNCVNKDNILASTIKKNTVHTRKFFHNFICIPVHIMSTHSYCT